MRTIRASEIGDYVFCHRAWWLRYVQGHTSANLHYLAEGAAAHAEHGQQVALATLLRWAALALFFLAAVALIASWL